MMFIEWKTQNNKNSNSISLCVKMMYRFNVVYNKLLLCFYEIRQISF